MLRLRSAFVPASALVVLVVLLQQACLMEATRQQHLEQEDEVSDTVRLQITSVSHAEEEFSSIPANLAQQIRDFGGISKRAFMKCVSEHGGGQPHYVYEGKTGYDREMQQAFYDKHPGTDLEFSCNMNGFVSFYGLSRHHWSDAPRDTRCLFVMPEGQDRWWQKGRDSTSLDATRCNHLIPQDLAQGNFRGAEFKGVSDLPAFFSEGLPKAVNFRMYLKQRSPQGRRITDPYVGFYHVFTIYLFEERGTAKAVMLQSYGATAARAQKEQDGVLDEHGYKDFSLADYVAPGAENLFGEYGGLADHSAAALADEIQRICLDDEGDRTLFHKLFGVMPKGAFHPSVCYFSAAPVVMGSHGFAGFEEILSESRGCNPDKGNCRCRTSAIDAPNVDE